MQEQVARLFEPSNNILQTLDARSLALNQSTTPLQECVNSLLAKVTDLGKVPAGAAQQASV